jgi:hypothetical protein
MRAGKVVIIIGLVLFGLAIVLAYALGFRNLYFNIAAIILMIAGAVVYLWALGGVSTRMQLMMLVKKNKLLFKVDPMTRYNVIA